MKVNKRELKNVAMLLACAGGFVTLFPLLGLRINLTPSHVPAGIWRSYPPGALEVGDIVTYDVREFFAAVPQVYEERLRFETPKILKRVAALPGALIERSGDVILVDGELYPRARIVNESWRKVEYPLVVPDGAVWLMADTESAWDSRYHGPLPENLVVEKNRPVLVWP